MTFGLRSHMPNAYHENNDYPHHKSSQRKEQYLESHSKMHEDWGRTGAATAGFWSRHMLWSEKTPDEIEKHLQKELGLKTFRLSDAVRAALTRPYRPCPRKVQR